MELSSGKLMKIGIKFFHYKEHLAPMWSEHGPTLRVFLDRNFERDPVEFKLNPDNPSSVYHINISGEMKDDKLSNTAAIGFKGYVTSNTPTGIPCKVSAGKDFVYIKDIMEQLEFNNKFEKTIEMKLHSVHNFPKGKITMVITRASMNVGNEISFKPVADIASSFIGGSYARNAASKMMMKYINQTIRAKDVLKERTSKTDRIKVPAYMGDPGLEMTNGVPLPAFAFLLYETPKVTEAFLENSVEICAEREGLDLNDWDHFSRAEQCEMFKSVVCYPAQYLPYIGDTVDTNTRHARYNKALKHGCENFESGFERGAGDCEDDEEAIMMTVSALRSIKLGEKASKPLVAIQKMSRQYIAAMSLDSVTSAAVTGANDSSASIGAHMNLNLIPASYFKECLERNNPEVSKQLPWEQFDLGDGKNLIKIAEGTGMYYSKEHVEDARYVTNYIYPEGCFATFKKPILHKQGTHSPFYRQGLTLFVGEFLEKGSNYSGFWYCDKNEYRGANFEDLENRSDKVQFMPQPRIPDDVLAISKEAVKIRSPPFHLDLTKRSTGKIHKYAERIASEINGLNRKPDHIFPPAIMYTTANLLNENDANAVISTLRRKHGVWKVEYTLEDVCDALPVGIRFKIFADPTMDESFNIR